MGERRVGSATGRRRARGNCDWDVIYERRIKMKKSIGNNIYIDNTYICYSLCINIYMYIHIHLLYHLYTGYDVKYLSLHFQDINLP